MSIEILFEQYFINISKKILISSASFFYKTALPIIFGTTIFFTKIFSDLLIGDLVYNTAGIVLIGCLALSYSTTSLCINFISQISTENHLFRTLERSLNTEDREAINPDLETEISLSNRTGKACSLFTIEVLRAVFYGSLATLFHKTGLLSDRLANISQFCLADWIMSKTPVTKYISTNLKSLSFTNILPTVQATIFWGHNIMHWTGYISPLRHLFLAPMGCKLSKAMDQYFDNIKELPLSNPLVFLTSSAVNCLPESYSLRINTSVQRAFDTSKSWATSIIQNTQVHIEQPDSLEEFGPPSLSLMP